MSVTSRGPFVHRPPVRIGYEIEHRNGAYVGDKQTYIVRRVGELVTVARVGSRVHELEVEVGVAREIAAALAAVVNWVDAEVVDDGDREEP